MKDKEFLDLIHIKVHALRMLKDYKPSQFEIDVNKMIAELYASECKECKEKEVQLKYAPQEAKKDSFLGGLFK